jgi:hypothetical protein
MLPSGVKPCVPMTMRSQPSAAARRVSTSAIGPTSFFVRHTGAAQKWVNALQDERFLVRVGDVHGAAAELFRESDGVLYRPLGAAGTVYGDEYLMHMLADDR